MGSASEAVETSALQRAWADPFSPRSPLIQVGAWAQLLPECTLVDAPLAPLVVTYGVGQCGVAVSCVDCVGTVLIAAEVLVLGMRQWRWLLSCSSAVEKIGL